MRKAAAEALGKLGPEAQEAVSALVAALKDKDVTVRQAVAEALKKIVPTWTQRMFRIYLGEATVSELVTALKDVEVAVRELAAEALGKLGPEAQEAVPALHAALRDSEEAVREAAAEALETVTPNWARWERQRANPEQSGEQSRGLWERLRGRIWLWGRRRRL